MALVNKLGIRDSVELARTEERLSKQKALEMFESGYLEQLEAGTFGALAKIHEYLFSDIYEFAGKIRDENLAKGNFRFAPVMYLEAALEKIEKMPQSTYDEIIEKYVEMNVAHPDIEIKYLLKRALTDEVNDRELYMKGIDTSYYYEGYAVFRTDEL